MKTKSEIRTKYLNVRKNLDTHFCYNTSEKIIKKVINIDEYKKTDILYVYANVNNEVYTGSLIEHALHSNKIVACPKVTDNTMHFCRIYSIDSLVPGKFGIREPDNEDVIDSDGLIIVPGVAFDKYCSRIGYGGGYYDRFLQYHNFFTIAPAYEMQIANKLPAEHFDKKVDMIITEQNIYTNQNQLQTQRG